jgi:hypothetical protein
VWRCGPPLTEVSEQVRQAVAPLVPDRVVDVIIGDISEPDQDMRGPAGRDHEG